MLQAKCLRDIYMRQESGPDLYYLSYAVAKEAYDTWIRLGNDGCYFVGPTIEEKAEAVFSSYSIPARFIHEYLLVSVHLLFHEKVEITFELPSKTRQAKWVGLRGNVTHRDIWGLFLLCIKHQPVDSLVRYINHGVGSYKDIDAAILEQKIMLSNDNDIAWQMYELSAEPLLLDWHTCDGK